MLAHNELCLQNLALISVSFSFSCDAIIDPVASCDAIIDPTAFPVMLVNPF